MAAIRKETLDILKDELINPSTFLKQMLACSKTGMVSLNIVQQMSKELCKLPLDYLVHCLTKDKAGFAYDPVEEKVCLDSQIKTEICKTTPYGTIDPEQEDTAAEQTRIYPEHKTPFFRPMFSVCEKVFPIYFDKGEFYVDDLPEKRVNIEKPNIEVPEHDVHSIDPLTNHERRKVVLQSGLSECFNCGAKDHIFSECPEPTDIKRINRKKRELKNNQRRLYEHLEIQSKRDSFIPGKLSSTLKDALGMSENQEPPYYHNMRIHGYPPGYVINSDPSKPTPTFQSVYQQPFNDEYPDLKIYDDAYVEEQQTEEQKHNEEPKETVQIKLIDYGIDFNNLGVDTSKLEGAMQQCHSTTATYNSSSEYPTEYPYQSTVNDYGYYYSATYYDYSGYDQYSAPPGYGSESTATILHSPLPPPPPLSSQINNDVSKNQPLVSVDTQYQANTYQAPSNDNDSVDMDISDDEDDI